MSAWNPFSKAKGSSQSEKQHDSGSNDDMEGERKAPKWSLGILQDRETDEVPGIFRMNILSHHTILMMCYRIYITPLKGRKTQ